MPSLEFHKVKIICHSVVGSNSRVFIDDEEIRGITDIKIDVSPNGLNRIKIELIPQELEINAEVMSHLLEKKYQKKELTRSDLIDLD